MESRRDKICFPFIINYIHFQYIASQLVRGTLKLRIMTDFFIIVSARHCPFQGDPDFFIFFASLASFARQGFWVASSAETTLNCQNEPESQGLTPLNSTATTKKISTEPKEPKKSGPSGGADSLVRSRPHASRQKIPNRTYRLPRELSCDIISNTRICEAGVFHVEASNFDVARVTLSLRSVESRFDYRCVERFHGGRHPHCQGYRQESGKRSGV